MTNTLPLAKGLHFGLEAITETYACLGKRGGGKTYAALRLAECMLDVGAQVVAIDPVGKWWSLRLKADGKTPAHEIPVFGGHHGDLPLATESGALLADLVVDQGVSAILDVSLMRKAERKRFATDFAEQLYQRKKEQAEPTAMHLAIEEAQLFVPQRTNRGEERMLGAFEDLVKLGRNVGIGATLISQRPQAVNKDVLNQCECLLVFQTTGSQERKALREWIRDAAGEHGELADEVPSLQPGEAYVWSPGWLRIFKRCRISKRRTFDASATPKLRRDGKGAPAATRPLEPEELARLEASMATVVEEAKARDPKHLRARVRELEGALAKAKAGAPDPEALERAREEGRAEGARDAEARLRGLVAQEQRSRAGMVEALAGARSGLERAMQGVEKAEAAAREEIAVELGARRREGRPPAAPSATRARPEREVRPVPAATAGGRASGEARMLAVLAQYAPEGLPEGQWAALVGLKRSGGTWGTYKSRLRTRGHLREEGGRFYATAEGVAAAGEVPDLPTTADEVVKVWREKPGMRPVIPLVEAVLQAGEMDRAALADQVGITASGGTFGTYLSRARTARLLRTEGSVVRLGEAFDGLA